MGNFQKLYFACCPELIDYPFVHCNNVIDCTSSRKRIETFVSDIANMNVAEVIKRNREIEVRNRKRGSSSSRIVKKIEKGSSSLAGGLSLEQ